MLKKSIVLLSFTFLLLSIHAQSVREVAIDLEKIKRSNEDVIDLVLQNPLGKDIELLSYEADQRMAVQIRTKIIPAYGYEFFRVKVNHSQLGDFSKQLQFHFDQKDMDILIRFNGKMKELPSQGIQKCPSFDDVPSKRKIAKRSRQLQNQIQAKLILLGKGQETSELLDDTHRSNNIVFLIDRSSSMKREGKMDLLKNSLEILLNSLREEDYLSMVAYDNRAILLLASTAVVEKDSIQMIIDQLNAEGSTNAIEGIELAINEGMKNYISKGNNQLYLVSDGAFELKQGSKGSKKLIEEAANVGMNVSVLAIKANTWSRRSLKELSRIGNGDLIRIDGDQDQKNLFKNIERNSRL